MADGRSDAVDNGYLPRRHGYGGVWSRHNGGGVRSRHYGRDAVVSGERVLQSIGGHCCTSRTANYDPK
jgi:hypothetical protein